LINFNYTLIILPFPSFKETVGNGAIEVIQDRAIEVLKILKKRRKELNILS
jgi:hypothetical protein